MKHILKQKIKKDHWYYVIPLLSCFVLNCIIYYGSRVIAAPSKHYDFTLDFDRLVPLQPWWTYIYLVCYLFWIVNYIMIGKIGKEHCMRFVTAEMLSRIICGIFYVLLPTTNVRPEVVKDSFSAVLLNWVYTIDAPTNLFPSIHCLVSWFCFIGIRGQKSIPKWYRVFSCIFAILVFVSTQTTKQHYVIDIIGAVAISELAYYIGKHTNWYKGVEKVFDCISNLPSAMHKKKDKSAGFGK